MQELAGLNSKGASTLMAQHLLAAADRYGLERLKLLCEATLCEDVAINNVATTLALAEQHHCSRLKSVCLKFVASRENLRGNSISALILDKLLKTFLNSKNTFLFWLSFLVSAVMQTEGFEYLKLSCPSVISELLEFVARVSEHSISVAGYGNDSMLDCGDINGRRVKPRLF